MDVLFGGDIDPEDEYDEKPSDEGGSARYIPIDDIDRVVVTKLA